MADDTNSALTERIIEFARTQQALRAARRVEPARSLVGGALQEQHGASLRMLTMQIPGQVLFGLASQLALILFAGMATYLTVRGNLAVPQAIALIVVIARYLEPFTVLSELAPAIEPIRSSLVRIQAVLRAPTLAAGSAKLADASAPPRIEFDNVSFGYAGEHANEYGSETLLDGVSFALQPGNTTASAVLGPARPHPESDRRLARADQRPGADRR